MPKSSKTFLLSSLFALVLSFPFLMALFANGYVTGIDESYQLQAAFSLAHGHGYTLSDLPALDLSLYNSRYMRNWPIGYSLIIAFFLKLGLNLEFAAKIFKTLMLGLSLFAWMNLAWRYLRNNKSLFIVYVGCLSTILIRTISSSTDILFSALFALLVLLATDEKYSKNGSEKFSYGRYFQIGILVSLMFLFRYQALFIFAALMVWIVHLYRNEYKKIIQALLASFILPILCVSVTFYANYLFSGAMTQQSAGGIEIRFFPFGLFQFLQGVFFAFIHQKVLLSFLGLIGVSGSLADMVVKGVSLSYFVMIFIAVLLVSKRSKCKPLALLFSIFSISIFLFLWALSIPFKFSPIWSYAIETRYYLFLSPFVLLLFLLLFEQRKVKYVAIKKVAFFVIIGFCCVFNLSWASFKNRYDGAESLRGHSVEKKIRAIALANPDHSIVVMASNPLYGIYLAELRIPVYLGLPDLIFLPDSFFSKNTIVVVACEEEETCSRDYGNIFSKYPFQNSLDSPLVYWREFGAGFRFSDNSVL